MKFLEKLDRWTIIFTMTDILTWPRERRRGGWRDTSGSQSVDQTRNTQFITILLKTKYYWKQQQLFSPYKALFPLSLSLCHNTHNHVASNSRWHQRSTWNQTKALSPLWVDRKHLIHHNSIKWISALRCFLESSLWPFQTTESRLKPVVLLEEPVQLTTKTTTLSVSIKTSPAV